MTKKRLQNSLLGSCLALGLVFRAGRARTIWSSASIAPTTGLYAQVGKDMVNGFQLYLDQHGDKLGGADVKFIVEDDQGKPDTGVTKAKKLILQDKVNMFIGGFLASTGYALAPVSTAEKTLYISSVSSADDLTQRQLSKYPYFAPRQLFELATASQPLGQWACDQGYKKIVTIARRLCFRLRIGRWLPESVRGLRRQDHPENLAAARHQRFWALHPDHQGDADAMFSLMVGPMALQFPKQLRGVRLSQNRSLAAGPATTNSGYPLWATR